MAVESEPFDVLIAHAIQLAFRKVSEGCSYVNFAATAEEIDPRLYGPCTQLTTFEKSLWDLADEYFDSLWHGFATVGRLDTHAAGQLLREASNAILAGETDRAHKLLDL